MAYQPGSVTALITHLESSGFRLVSESRGGMGGVQLIYTGAFDEVPATVEINADRGLWQALLKFDDMGRFTTAPVLTAYLDGTDVVDSDIDFEVAFIRERGAEAATAYRQDPDAARRITEIGRAHMARVRKELRKEFGAPSVRDLQQGHDDTIGLGRR